MDLYVVRHCFPWFSNGFAKMNSSKGGRQEYEASPLGKYPQVGFEGDVGTLLLRKAQESIHLCYNSLDLNWQMIS